MRRAIVLALLPLVLAGCTAKGDDPFAYTKKPLFATTFHFSDGQDVQMFRVEDGSITRIRLHLWINATAGDGVVEVIDPSGRTVVSASQDGTYDVPFTLGVWQVRVTPQGTASGTVEVRATR